MGESEFQACLTPGNLLILRNGKKEKNRKNAEWRYTGGTQNRSTEFFVFRNGILPFSPPNPCLSDSRVFLIICSHNSARYSVGICCPEVIHKFGFRRRKSADGFVPARRRLTPARREAGSQFSSTSARLPRNDRFGSADKSSKIKRV
jgi:hypothetical protein